MIINYPELIAKPQHSEGKETSSGISFRNNKIREWEKITNIRGGVFGGTGDTDKKEKNLINGTGLRISTLKIP